jgi:two-component system C4-dicarboxylate transport response regulator DctD
MERPLALVVDGDAATRSFVREVLDERGIETLAASDRREAMELLRTRPVAVLLAAADLSREATRVHPTVVPVVFTSESKSDDALSQMGDAAFDVLQKPLEEERLGAVAQRAVAQHGLMEELQRLRRHTQPEGDGLLGTSQAMERVRDRIRRLAQGTEPVLIVGESGSGKEFVARCLHALSSRHDRPFVAVDVRRPSDTVQAELFGRQGASGRLREAEGGTLYLDGVDEMSPELQEAAVPGPARRQRRRPGGGPRRAPGLRRHPRARAHAGRDTAPAGARGGGAAAPARTSGGRPSARHALHGDAPPDQPPASHPPLEGGAGLARGVLLAGECAASCGTRWSRR